MARVLGKLNMLDTWQALRTTHSAYTESSSLAAMATRTVWVGAEEQIARIEAPRKNQRGQKVCSLRALQLCSSNAHF